MSGDQVIVDSIPARINQNGQQSGDALAAKYNGKSYTWAEFSAKTNRVANRLLQQGIKKGDRVALLGKTTAAYSEAMAGILTANAVMVPLPTMITADTLSLILQDCQPELLFIDQHCFGMLKSLIEDRSEHLPANLVALDFDDARLPGMEAWLGESSTDFPEIEIRESDTCCVLYSSGTTGVPKGIVLSNRARMGQVRNFAQMEFGPGAVNIISTPLYTLGAVTTWMPACYAGGCNLIMDKFDAREFLSLVQTCQATHAMLVPIQFQRILALSDFDQFDLSSMKYKYTGSAPMSVATKQEIVARFPGEMFEFYSLTEGGVTTVLMANHFPDKLASVGVPAGNCVIKILDENDEELPTGEVGEIVGRSEIRMNGYLNKKNQSEAASWTDSQGLSYIRSGDMGYLDSDGFLFLLDRKKDMIISGGLNIYAADIEAVLGQHPDLLEVAVIGAPSEKWGETPIALAVLKDEVQSDPELILEWANERLGKGQRLTAVNIRQQLPRNHLGKFLKSQMRQELTDSGVVYS